MHVAQPRNRADVYTINRQNINCSDHIHDAASERQKRDPNVIGHDEGGGKISLQLRNVRPHLLLVYRINNVFRREFLRELWVSQRHPICRGKPERKQQKRSRDETEVAAKQRRKPGANELANRVSFQGGALVDTAVGAGGECIKVWYAAIVWKVAAGNRQIGGHTAIQIPQPIELRWRSAADMAPRAAL